MAKAKKAPELVSRIPVVGVLGHIDHGKTTLLDAIRHSHLQEREAGGITQHIGAYLIDHKGQRITFIDTPGHAAFSQMRARGARITDLVVLVVAADEGVKPQTKESYEYIQKAKVPFLVAITKMDMPSANPNRVKDELARVGVLTEDRGGEIVAVPVSAKTGEGINELLEMIGLVVQMQELPETAEEEFEGVVVESRLDRSKGPVATVVVKRGVLRVRDEIWTGEIQGRIRALEDENGQSVIQAGPGRAVLVLGFSKVPGVGEKVIGQELGKKTAEMTGIQKVPHRDPKKITLIVKADTHGTLEAVVQGVPKEAQLIQAEVGAISENDIVLAQATGAVIHGFQVAVPGPVKKLADIEGVTIRIHTIIYDLFDEVQELVERKKKRGKKEEVRGRAEVAKKFHVGGQEVAGGTVLSGRLSVGDVVRLERGEKVVGEAKIVSLHQGREEKTKVKEEEEFGAVLQPQLDFKSGDVLVSVLPLPLKS